MANVIGSQQKQTVVFDDQAVRYFMIASIVWGMVAMAAGLLAATQLSFWQMNGKFLEWITLGLLRADGIAELTYGRMRPLHTNAAIFAFVGNMMFAGIYHSTQRLCRARLASPALTWLHFWGWQLIIVAAALTLLGGFTRGKEYAELIWPINIAVSAIWIVFAVNFFWTLRLRREPTLYVAIWFYIATIVTVPLLYVVNHLSIPTSILHSYPIFGGVQDALVQWWYGHNAVAFFLTTPILGIMYYYVPKAANRPVYSYRLSIVHFWSLVFLYIWAGPHHLLNTSLPQWLQSLGMLFSIMLWAPSWGGMLNGLLTLRGAWNRLRSDPVLKFFVAGITFYGMATFEGPLLSIRAVNQLSHYTDWTIGHVHGGTLGWNGLMAAGMFYFLAPRIWNARLHSIALANLHFWIALVGILFYVAAMWVSGIVQGLMLNATSEGGTLLTNPNFIDTLTAIRPAMVLRILGGGLYLIGFGLLVYNLWRTVRGAQPMDGMIEVEGSPTNQTLPDSMPWNQTFLNPPVVYTGFFLVFISLWLFGNDAWMLVGLVFSIVCVLIAVAHGQRAGRNWSEWYEALLANWAPFTALTFAAVFIGGAVQIIPTLLINRAENVEERIQIPYEPLELLGRDIYISEGCYNCHTQMIRMLVPDVMRYGDYSRVGESIYDFPHQWGSKRTGPDLARAGGSRGNDWHFIHMRDPRQTSPGSNMPPYPDLFDTPTDYEALPNRIAVQQTLGVPYPAQWAADEIIAQARAQAEEIAADIRRRNHDADAHTQIIALIAYLQKLGAWTEVPSDPESIGWIHGEPNAQLNHSN